MRIKSLCEKGMTLVEAIAAIVVAGIAAAGFVSLYLRVMSGYAEAEMRTVAAFLAQGLMEEIKSKRFDEHYVSPFSDSLGTEWREDIADKTSFDDVDDFNGWSETPPRFNGYVLFASVKYVNDTNLDEVSSSQTGYKRVTVAVSVGDEKMAVLSSVVVSW